MEAKKMIMVTPEIRADLMREIPVSEKTVYNALNFATGGYTAETIRRRALELGGKLMKEVEPEADAPAADTASKGDTCCPGCIVAKYPPCSKHIPCCQCDLKEGECNGWQPCPKQEEKEEHHG